MTSGPAPLLFWLFIGPALLYASCQLLLAAGILRVPRRRGIFTGRISVIVAARNEEANVPGLIDALAHQTRLPDEVFIIDDRSEDHTASVVESAQRTLPWLRLIRVTSIPPGLTPKRHAILRGIEAASGDLICLTDADCVPPAQWLERLSGAVDGATTMVVGTYVPDLQLPDTQRSIMAGLVARFVSYEKFRTTVLGSGSHGLGMPWLANGASFGYRRATFLERGGFGNNVRTLSGDDDLLLQRFARVDRRSIACVVDPLAAVRTHGPRSVREFIRQRLRHHSAGRSYPPTVQIALAVYHAANILASLSLFATILTGYHMLLMAYVIKTCADLVFLTAGEVRLSRARDWIAFVPLELVYVAYIAVIGPLSLIAPVSWKPASQE